MNKVCEDCDRPAIVDRGEIRDDLRRYVETALQDAPEFTAGAADVSVRA